MKRSRQLQTITSIVLAAGAASPAVTALASGKHVSTAKPKTYKGPIVDMRWGPVQAQITVKNKKITSADVLVSPDTFRSQDIDSQAVPLLIQETLQAQNANISLLSGATMTSAAYAQSLQTAVQKAKKDKLLK